MKNFKLFIFAANGVTTTFHIVKCLDNWVPPYDHRQIQNLKYCICSYNNIKFIYSDN